MTDLKEIIDLGERLGYKGEGLQRFVETETSRMDQKRKDDLDREERARVREETKLKEDRDHEHRMKMMELEIERTKTENEGHKQSGHGSTTAKIPKNYHPFVKTRMIWMLTWVGLNVMQLHRSGHPQLGPPAAVHYCRERHWKLTPEYIQIT